MECVLFSLVVLVLLHFLMGLHFVVSLAYVRLCSNSCSLFSTEIVLAEDLSVSCSLTFRSVTSFLSYVLVSTSIYHGLRKSLLWRYWLRILLFYVRDGLELV